MTPKALGFVRKIDSVGRIVIPVEIRKQYKWEPGTSIEMLSTADGIVLRTFGTDKHKEKVVGDFKSIMSSLSDLESKEVLDELIAHLDAKKNGNQ
ncbi:AbrB/MazE/SpoVT family DNA-binding domain-containing protein [Priestia flexa]|uniref:AbrB/MazE/SpoVT family DNA-binding domain-containing protein n=1 Tax=Priestia flexa TaxID=86664 RepID=UPI002491317E|nr:AbrB/MazE/SpoVT family DNA-binding domain-containing protein [Priestia flexa]